MIIHQPFFHQIFQIKAKNLFVFFVVCLLTAPTCLVVAQENKQLSIVEKQKLSDQLLNTYNQQIYFTQNKGQWDANVLYKADFGLGQAIATSKGMMVGTFDAASVIAMNQKIEADEKAPHHKQSQNSLNKSTPLKGHGWLMNFVDASPTMKIESKDAHADKFNYFIGDDKSKYATDVNSFQEVWYNNVYDKVDVRYYPSAEGQLEYDIICKPGFDKKQIAIQYDGIEKMRVDKEGELVLKTSVGNMTFAAPIAYQNVDGKRVPVEVKYSIKNKNTLHFKLGDYNNELPLIIDPIALRWATWATNNSLGMSHGHGIWVDPSDGGIYITGFNTYGGLITVGAFQNNFGGLRDAFISKYLEPANIGGSGTRVWQTYLGGSGVDVPSAIEQGIDGNLYIDGTTDSKDFPILGGSAFNGSSVNDTNEDSTNIFITKINTAGNSIKSAIIGGDNSENVYDLRTNAAGEIIVAGGSYSGNLGSKYSALGAVNIITPNVYVLIFKINQNLNNLIWMHDFGGNINDQDGDEGRILLTDNATGNVFLGGTAQSPNFPTLNPRQPSLNGLQDGFFQMYDNGGNLIWSSYFNSQSNASSSVLCMDFNSTKDTLYFGGITTGLDPSNISSSGVLSSSRIGRQDFFVGKMSINQGIGSVTYLGGSDKESNMMGLAVDESNDVYIFGYTTSSDFPVTSNGLQTYNAGGSDKTFTKLSSDLSTLKYGTYYGGTNEEYDPIGERGIKFSNCRIYTIVTAGSNSIPLTKGALTTSKISTYTQPDFQGNSSLISEPGIVVWANPPDITNNNITADQTICGAATPNSITGTLPTYVLPTISRNNVESAHPSVSSTLFYQWQKSIDKTNWVDIVGATNQNLDNTLIGPLNQTTYFKRVFNGDACVISSGVTMVTITVMPADKPTIGAITQPTCTVNTGSVVLSGLPATGTWQLTRNPGGVIVSGTGTTYTATGVPVGKSNFTVTNSLGCISSVSSDVQIVPVIKTPTISNVVQPTCVVATGGVTINDLPTSGTWTLTQKPTGTTFTGTGSSSIITLLPVGNYTFTVANAAGCLSAETDTVKITALPTVNIITNDTTVCQANAVTLTALGGVAGSYTWSPAAGLSSTSSATPIATPTTTTKYYVTATTANGCIRKDSVTVTINSLPVIQTTNDFSICTNKSATLATTANVPITSYTWLPATGLSSATIANPTVKVSATTKYIVTGKDANGCLGKDTLVITAVALPTITKTPDSTICHNTSINLNATGGVGYVWTPAATLINANSATPTASPFVNTKYYVTVTNSTGCDNIDSVFVTVRQLPTFTVTPNASICDNQKQQLIATGGDTYSWTPSTGLSATNIANPVASIKTATTYNVHIIYSACNDVSDLSTSLTVRPSPIIKASNSNNVDCLHPTSVLNATGGIDYLWTPSAGLNHNNIQSPTTSIAATQQFIVRGSDANGCFGYDSVTVTASFNGDIEHYIPNAFSPNDDGLNDCYRIKVVGIVSSFKLAIYNRYGERIFYTENPNDCWDGTYNGKKADADNYVYHVVAITNCGNFDRKGNLVLVH